MRTLLSRAPLHLCALMQASSSSGCYCGLYTSRLCDHDCRRTRHMAGVIGATHIWLFESIRRQRPALPVKSEKSECHQNSHKFVQPASCEVGHCLCRQASAPTAPRQILCSPVGAVKRAPRLPALAVSRASNATLHRLPAHQICDQPLASNRAVSKAQQQSL